jgi:hypothetical protein
VLARYRAIERRATRSVAAELLAMDRMARGGDARPARRRAKKK